MSEKAPILRLYPDMWAHICRLLDTTEVIQLMTCLCNELSNNVAAGMRNFSLVWHSSDYMDLELVSRCISRSSYTKLSLKTHEPEQLVWKPIFTDLWRSSLVELELNFIGSIELMLSASRPKTTQLLHQLPHLTSLTLINSMIEARLVEAAISFEGLPLALSRLHLASAPTYTLPTSYLKHLPPTVTTLWLDIIISLEAAPDSHLTLPLDDLPPKLSVLALNGTIKHPWSLHCLPPQLVEFHFLGRSALSSSKSNYLAPELFANMSHLRTINMPMFDFNVHPSTTNFRPIPPSVTSLSTWLGDRSANPSDIPPQVIQAAHEIGALYNLLALGSFQPPRITSLTFSLDVGLLVPFPSTLTHLAAPRLNRGTLPPSLTSLNCHMPGPNFHGPGAYPWLLPPRLKHLTLGHALSPLLQQGMRKIIRQLPKSIESLDGPFTRPWLLFINSRQRKGAIPLLKSISSTQDIPWTHLNHLPSTLTTYKGTVHVGREWLKHLSPLRLANFKHSQLRQLRISFIFSRRRALVVFPLLLKNLPLQLRDLYLAGLPELPYEITWPQKLKKLSYATVEQFKSTEVRQLPACLLSSTYDLSDDSPAMPLSSELPPHISRLRVKYATVPSYFEAQARRRSAEMELHAEFLPFVSKV